MVRSHSLCPIELRGLRDHCTAENLVRRVRHSAHAATLLQSHHSPVRIRPAPPYPIQKGYFASESESGEASACKAGLRIADGVGVIRRSEERVSLKLSAP